MVSGASNRATRMQGATGGVVPRAVLRARAGLDATAAAAVPTASATPSDATNAAGRFERAEIALQAARDPRQAAAQLAIMQSAMPQLEGSAGAADFRTRLAAATRRVAALPYLQGNPTLARPSVGRQPAASTAAATSSDAASARAWLAGYTGAAGGFFARLGQSMPFLAKLLPGLFGGPAPTPAFKQLSAPAQAKFLNLARGADARGQVALHQLLVAGKLSSALLDALSGLAAAPHAPTIDGRTLLTQTLVELADPATIEQKSRGTCATTAVQMLIALREPEVYVGLVRGLASPDGVATLPNGDVIKRLPDWAASNDGGRSLPGRLLQSSLMDYANGAARYSNADDMDVDPVTHQESPSGLDGDGAAKLLDAVTPGAPSYAAVGVDYASSLSGDARDGLDANISSAADLLRVLQNPKAIDAASQDTLMQDLTQQAKADDPVYCTLIYPLHPEVDGVGYHAVLVTGVKNGQVSYLNPWGDEETMGAAAFRQSLVSIDVRKGS